MIAPGDLDERLTRLHPQVVAWRRALHAHPELSRVEFDTTATIAAALRSLGLQPTLLAGECGVVVDIGTGPGERVALRADIDALPIQDVKDVPYASTRPGVCHACGHDAHTAIALGVCAVLAELERAGTLPRPVRVIFQPCEESSPGGASEIIAAGHLEGVERIFAVHCDPQLEVGRIGLRTGAITSAADVVTVRLRGPGGHTSRPHLSADLVGAVGSVVTQTPVLLTRRVDPRSAVSLMWGRVEAGHAPNAIPDTGLLMGTLRCLEPDAWRTARALLPALVADVVRPHGAIEVEVDLSGGIPPTVNGAAAIAVLGAACVEFGAGTVSSTAQSLGGEDFGAYLEVVDGAMARLGVRPVGATSWPDLHTSAFDLDEGALDCGVRLLLGAVLTDRC